MTKQISVKITEEEFNKQNPEIAKMALSFSDKIRVACRLEPLRSKGGAPPGNKNAVGNKGRWARSIYESSMLENNTRKTIYYYLTPEEAGKFGFKKVSPELENEIINDEYQFWLAKNNAVNYLGFKLEDENLILPAHLAHKVFNK